MRHALIAALGMLLGGANFAISQPWRLPEPIRVDVTAVERSRDAVHPSPQKQKKGPGIYSGLLAGQGTYLTLVVKQDVEALLKNGLASGRPVQLMDGPTLIANCTLVAVSQDRRHEKLLLLLAFDSLPEAQRAANAIMEPVDDYLARYFSNEKLWR